MRQNGKYKYHNDSGVIDFTGAKRVHRVYGGSDQKIGVEYNGDIYMLKFADRCESRSDIATSYINNVVSEYVSSHIAAIIGRPVHETYLGYYGNHVVVGCKDFRNKGDATIELSSLMREYYSSSDLGKHPRLQQIYDTISETNDFVDGVDTVLDDYWDLFVVDSFVGNFDRHAGNVAYIAHDDKDGLDRAPWYDFGSSLCPQLNDRGMEQVMDDKRALQERCFLRPVSSLIVNGKDDIRVSYYDMMASGYDKRCSEAVCRIVPKLDMDKVHDVIDNVPLITDLRKDFYHKLMDAKKSMLLDRCYAMCVNQAYDKEAYDRLRTGVAYTEDIFAHDVKVGKFNQVCADRSVDADDLVRDIVNQPECGDRSLLDS